MGSSKDPFLVAPKYQGRRNRRKQKSTVEGRSEKEVLIEKKAYGNVQFGSETFLIKFMLLGIYFKRDIFLNSLNCTHCR